VQALVHIRRCASYEEASVADAVASAIAGAEAAGTFPEVAGRTVLLKPNMLSAAEPERSVSTHPEVLRAAIREFRKRGAEVAVGESPAVHGSVFAARKCGLLAVAEAEGVRWADFSATAVVENPGGRLVKRFEIASEAASADLVVSLPKLKTHQLMYYTGAMKNLFGTISGLQKAAFHFRFPERRDFGAMLTDLCLALKPSFSLMDAVVAMEGHGPGNGESRQVGLILASADILALDWAAASIIGYDPADVPNLADALSRGVWMSDPSELTIDGPPMDELRIHDFKRIKEVGDNGFGRMILPPSLYNLVRNATVPRPFFRDRRCLRCGECVAICPAKALSFSPARRAASPAGLDKTKAAKRVEVDYDACIRCYCCDEVCPAKAIDLRRFF